MTAAICQPKYSSYFATFCPSENAEVQIAIATRDWGVCVPLNALHDRVGYRRHRHLKYYT
jgi:hypothetical protein